MTNLSEITIDKIETDIMSVLYANMDKKFTQATLFNKLLDKYERQTLTLSNFKSKYLLAIKIIMSNPIYDDIIIEKQNGIYYITCSSSNVNDLENYIDNSTIQVSFDKSDISNMYDYIYDNNLKEFTELYDKFDNNSIFHELILYNNVKQTSKLLCENKFDFKIKNYKNQTPIDLINSNDMSKLIINELIKKNSVLENKFNQEKSNVETLVINFTKKIDYYESEEYKTKIINNISFIDIVVEKTRNYHKFIKFYFLSFVIGYLIIMFNNDERWFI